MLYSQTIVKWSVGIYVYVKELAWGVNIKMDDDLREEVMVPI